MQMHFSQIFIRATSPNKNNKTVKIVIVRLAKPMKTPERKRTHNATIKQEKIINPNKIVTIL